MIFAIGLTITFISGVVAYFTAPTLVDYLDQTPRFHASTVARLGLLLGCSMMVGSAAMLALRYMP